MQVLLSTGLSLLPGKCYSRLAWGPEGLIAAACGNVLHFLDSRTGEVMERAGRSAGKAGGREMRSEVSVPSCRRTPTSSSDLRQGGSEGGGRSLGLARRHEGGQQKLAAETEAAPTAVTGPHLSGLVARQSGCATSSSFTCCVRLRRRGKAQRDTGGRQGRCLKGWRRYQSAANGSYSLKLLPKLLQRAEHGALISRQV